MTTLTNKETNMNYPNLTELSQRIYQTNKAAGWWDIPRPRVQTAWLIITELAEATEAERADKYADLEAFEAAKEEYKRYKDPDATNHFRVAFKTYIKDTFEDEIADAVIRLLDFAGSDGNVTSLYHATPTDVEINRSNEEAFFEVSNDLMEYAKDKDSDGYLSCALTQLCAIAKRVEFDLWQHVELKLKYNATRPKMHGGKKF